jgi:hypothetical protein
MRETRRELDAIGVVAWASVQHQRDAVHTWCAGMEAVSPQWVFIGRSHDCTPVRLSFGQLGGLVSIARYWHRVGTRPAKLLTQGEWNANRQALPSHGIIELMAQTGRIAWPEPAQAVDDDDGSSRPCTVRSHDLYFPPLFLARGNASTIFAALKRADPSLTFTKVIELTKTVDFVIVFIGHAMYGPHELRGLNTFQAYCFVRQRIVVAFTPSFEIDFSFSLWAGPEGRFTRWALLLARAIIVCHY